MYLLHYLYQLASVYQPSTIGTEHAFCQGIPTSKLLRQDLNDKSYYHALIKIRKLVSFAAQSALFPAREFLPSRATLPL